MNTYPKLQKPFMFWLVQRFLPADNHRKVHIQPISNREFYGIMAMICIGLLALEIAFHVIA
jgi:hypothetical protein